eukprot:9282701-Ditylum_brightwellii.AAC.1
MLSVSANWAVVAFFFYGAQQTSYDHHLVCDISRKVVNDLYTNYAMHFSVSNMLCQHLVELSIMGFCWNQASFKFSYPQKYTDWSN